jgi:hypothetical protein
VKKCQVAGMSQSGSTLLFNIVRLILKKSKTEYELTKSHEPHIHSDFYIVSLRDIRDTTASYYLKYSHCWLSAVESAQKNIGWVKQCEALAAGVHPDAPGEKKKALFYKYEDYQADKFKQITKLISFLGLDKFSDAEIRELIFEAEGIIWNAPSQLADNNQNYLRNEFYKETLMLKEHRTKNKGKVGGYKDHLSRNQGRALLEMFSGWMHQYGYKV